MTQIIPANPIIAPARWARTAARETAAPVGPAGRLYCWTTIKAVVFALRWQAFSLVCLACHVILVRDVGAFCFPLILLCLAGACAHSRLAGLIMYAQILLYQNVLVSLFSPGMSKADFTVLSGTSFAAVLLLAAPPLIGALRPSAPGREATSRAALAVAVAIGVAAAYAAFGASVVGPMEAVVGFRNATAMLLSVAAGLAVGADWDYRTVAAGLAVSLLPGLLLTVMEIADPGWYLSLIHATDFNNLKHGGPTTPWFYTAADVVERSTASLFNTVLLPEFADARAYRFGGPNMHSISYGYVLATAALMILSIGWWALALPLFVLLMLSGVKGAAVLAVATVLLYALWWASRSRAVLLAAGFVFAVLYVGLGILSGLRNGDFHVIGFVGGVNGFLANPFGHGLGAGGNLSVGTLSLTQWQSFQHKGADVGLESAVGVLLYQMGVGSVAIAAALMALLRAVPFGGGGRARGTDVIAIGLCIGLVNGVFQEEAYSPYAAGLFSLLCGVLAGNGRRQPVDAAHRP